ncbi:MAG: sortase, partial [Ardenticatenales bacterium]
AVLLRHIGWLLLACGIVLASIGVAIQGSRTARLNGELRTAAPPRFEDTVANQRTASATAMPATAVDASPSATTPAPSAAPTADGGVVKRVAKGGLDVVLGPHVVVFGDERGGARQDTSNTAEASAADTAAERSATARPIASPRAAGPAPTAAPTSLPPPDRIVIRSIDVDRPVVPIGWTVAIVDNETLESVWKTADDAAGWHKTSAPPAQVGNTVISGHNNIAGAVFGRLNELQEGDTIALHAGSAEVRYTVERTFIVKEAGASDEERRANNRWIEPTDDERLTLVTCYPPWSNTHRLIVIARPVVYILPTATPGVVNGDSR